MKRRTDACALRSPPVFPKSELIPKLRSTPCGLLGESPTPNPIPALVAQSCEQSSVGKYRATARDAGNRAITTRLLTLATLGLPALALILDYFPVQK